MRKGMGTALLLCGMISIISAACAVSNKNTENVSESSNMNESSIELDKDSLGGQQEQKGDDSQSQENIINQDSDGAQGKADAEPEDKSMIPELNMEAYEVPDKEVFQMIRDMKVGWNLGNTFDANSAENIEDDMKFETMWNSIQTSQAMITAVKEAGFETIRIPVSWHNHVSGDDFIINEAWLDRVQQVVDYAVNEDMYIILNTHHDVDYRYYYPSSEYLENSEKYMESIWTQLSARFADYDEHLIFESMNEPRLKDTDYEWNFHSNAEECVDAMNCINRLNQVFVDTVRGGGGNNSSRYLMVPGYCASLEGTTNNLFVLPNDTAEDRIIVSVHAYIPYRFALQADGEEGSISGFRVANKLGTGDIDELTETLYTRFVSQGIPVVLGEFGAREKKQNIQSRVEYAAYYVAAARSRGMTCCWWDNNSFAGNGENFGLYSRMVGVWRYPEIVEAMMQYSVTEQ